MSESSVNIVLRGIQLVIPYLISFAQINTSMGQLWCFIYCWLYIDAMTVIPRRFVPNFVARCSRYAANDRSRSISVRKDYSSENVITCQCDISLSHLNRRRRLLKLAHLPQGPGFDWLSRLIVSPQHETVELNRFRLFRLVKFFLEESCQRHIFWWLTRLFEHIYSLLNIIRHTWRGNN